MLQQYLPFTVLKRYGQELINPILEDMGCNSTYRLRY